MVFVVDGADWTFDDRAPESVEAKVLNFLALIERCRMHHDAVLIGDDFQSRAMYCGDDLWTIFARGGALALSTEDYQELTAWLGQARFYSDLDQWPEGFDDANVAIGDAAPEVNFDVAFVHHTTRAGKLMGCLSLYRSGLLITATSHGQSHVHFVGTEADRREFWRSALATSHMSLEQLSALASRAYPDILFIDGAIAGAAGFGGGYIPQREAVLSCFATLSDFGAWIFTTAPPSLRPSDTVGPTLNVKLPNQLIERRFRGFSIDAAPEKPNVRADRRCREAREVVAGTATLYCEWHLKLEPHRNRIYIHPPTSATSNKVVVAIMHEHLPLPGDG